MAISKQYQQAVDEHDVIMVRIMLKDSLVLDPTCRSFTEMENYARSRLDDLYQIHDGEVLIKDRSQWNKDYMNSQLAMLINNFSNERVELVKEMSKALCSDGDDSVPDTAPTSSKSHTARYVGTGLAVAGIATVIAGACASQIPVVIGGAVATAAGVAVFATDRRKNEQ